MTHYPRSRHLDIPLIFSFAINIFICLIYLLATTYADKMTSPSLFSLYLQIDYSR